MKPILLRIAFLFFFLLFQFSFLPAVFPSLAFVPPVFLSVAVSWALLRGFSAMWSWAMVAGLLADAIIFQSFGVSTIEILVVLAGFSLVSKRFLYGHPLERILIFGTAIWLCDMFFHGVTLLLSRPAFFEFFSAFLEMLSFPSLVFSWLLSLVLFGLTLRFTQAFERYMELFEQPSLGR